MTRAWTLGRGAFLLAAAVVILLCPVIFSVFFTSQVALTSLWFGLAAVSLTFLSGYGGMVSLAQTGLFGVAGLVSAKLAVTMGWNVWLAALAAPTRPPGETRTITRKMTPIQVAYRSVQLDR